MNTAFQKAPTTARGCFLAKGSRLCCKSTSTKLPQTDGRLNGSVTATPGSPTAMGSSGVSSLVVSVLLSVLVCPGEGRKVCRDTEASVLQRNYIRLHGLLDV